MKTSRKYKRQARQLFGLCLEQKTLDTQRTLNVVKMIRESRFRSRLNVLDHFRRLAELYTTDHTAVVQSAQALKPDLQASIQSDLSKQYGPGLQIVFTQAPELLGGMRIKVGCDVYDGSVQGGLTALEARF